MPIRQKLDVVCFLLGDQEKLDDPPVLWDVQKRKISRNSANGILIL